MEKLIPKISGLNHFFPSKKHLKRFTTGAFFVTLGIFSTVVGIAAVSYRLSFVVVESGIINARVVRLQTPSEGYVQAMYVQPGALVSAEQILAQIDGRLPEDDEKFLKLRQSQQEDQARLEKEKLDLQGQIQVSQTQLAKGRETLSLLQQQLTEITQRDEAVRQVETQIGKDNIREQQAIVQAAIARTNSAKLEYENHLQLLSQGAVSSQQVEQLRMNWSIATSELEAARAYLASLRSAQEASEQGIARSNRNNLLGGVLSDQYNNLLQAIQTQQNYIASLSSQIQALQQRLSQTEALLASKSSISSELTKLYEDPKTHDVLAPHTGVIYSVEREQGERVAKSEQLLTMVDCNELWVEALISADQAANISFQHPVSVKLASYKKTLPGEVSLVQPINSAQAQNRFTQVQALQPTIPPDLIGKPLTRVKVRVPPPPQYTESRQFCGLGQSARVTFRKNSSNPLLSWLPLGPSSKTSQR